MSFSAVWPFPLLCIARAARRLIAKGLQFASPPTRRELHSDPISPQLLQCIFSFTASPKSSVSLSMLTDPRHTRHAVSSSKLFTASRSTIVYVRGDELGAASHSVASIFILRSVAEVDESSAVFFSACRWRTLQSLLVRNIELILVGLPPLSRTGETGGSETAAAAAVSLAGARSVVSRLSVIARGSAIVTVDCDNPSCRRVAHFFRFFLNLRAVRNFQRGLGLGLGIATIARSDGFAKMARLTFGPEVVMLQPEAAISSCVG